MTSLVIGGSMFGSFWAAVLRDVGSRALKPQKPYMLAYCSPSS